MVSCRVRRKRSFVSLGGMLYLAGLGDIGNFRTGDRDDVTGGDILRGGFGVSDALRTDAHPYGSVGVGSRSARSAEAVRNTKDVLSHGALAVLRRFQRLMMFVSRNMSRPGVPRARRPAKDSAEPGR